MNNSKPSFSSELSGFSLFFRILGGSYLALWGTMIITAANDVGWSHRFVLVHLAVHSVVGLLLLLMHEIAKLADFLIGRVGDEWLLDRSSNLGGFELLTRFITEQFLVVSLRAGLYFFAKGLAPGIPVLDFCAALLVSIIYVLVIVYAVVSLMRFISPATKKIDALFNDAKINESDVVDERRRKMMNIMVLAIAGAVCMLSWSVGGAHVVSESAT